MFSHLQVKKLWKMSQMTYSGCFAPVCLTNSPKCLILKNEILEIPMRSCSQSKCFYIMDYVNDYLVLKVVFWLILLLNYLLIQFTCVCSFFSRR